MFSETNKVIIEYVKESFIEFIENVLNTRYNNIEYKFIMRVERNFGWDYDVKFRAESYENGVTYSLDLRFNSLDAISPQIPDRASLELMEWMHNPVPEFERLKIPYSEMKIILDIKMSTSKLLNETDLPKLMIEEYLLG